MRIRAIKKQSQNKANLLDAQMNISSVLTKDYENELCRKLQKNKPNQTQFQTQRPDGAAPEFLLFTLFDIGNMIYAIRKNIPAIRSNARILPKELIFYRRF